MRPAPNLSVILPVLGPSKNKGTAYKETKAVASVFDKRIPVSMKAKLER